MTWMSADVDREMEIYLRDLTQSPYVHLPPRWQRKADLHGLDRDSIFVRCSHLMPRLEWLG